MASIKAQSLDLDKGLYILASSGATVTIPQASIQAYFNQYGKDQTLVWLKDQVVTALGSDQISPDEMVLSVNTSGQLTAFGTQDVNQ